LGSIYYYAVKTSPMYSWQLKAISDVLMARSRRRFAANGYYTVQQVHVLWLIKRGQLILSRGKYL